MNVTKSTCFWALIVFDLVCVCEINWSKRHNLRHTQKPHLIIYQVNTHEYEQQASFAASNYRKKLIRIKIKLNSVSDERSYTSSMFRLRLISFHKEPLNYPFLHIIKSDNTHTHRFAYVECVLMKGNWKRKLIFKWTINQAVLAQFECWHFFGPAHWNSIRMDAAARDNTTKCSRSNCLIQSRWIKIITNLWKFDRAISFNIRISMKLHGIDCLI